MKINWDTEEYTTCGNTNKKKCLPDAFCKMKACVERTITIHAP
jgi:hypothetical protein